MCLPFVEYFPVRETAAPRIMVSPSTFENEVVAVPRIRPSVERRTNVNFTIFLIVFPFNNY